MGWVAHTLATSVSDFCDFFVSRLSCETVTHPGFASQ